MARRGWHQPAPAVPPASPTVGAHRTPGVRPLWTSWGPARGTGPKCAVAGGPGHSREFGRQK